MEAYSSDTCIGKGTVILSELDDEDGEDPILEVQMFQVFLHHRCALHPTALLTVLFNISGVVWHLPHGYAYAPDRRSGGGASRVGEQKADSH